MRSRLRKPASINSANPSLYTWESPRGISSCPNSTLVGASEGFGALAFRFAPLCLMGRSYSSVALLYSIDAHDSHFFCPRQQDTLGFQSSLFARLMRKEKVRNSLQIPRFRFHSRGMSIGSETSLCFKTKDASFETPDVFVFASVPRLRILHPSGMRTRA